MEFQLEEVDTLTGLEERILRAVSVVSQLKQENADLKSRLAEAEDEARLANAARNRAESELAGLRANSGKAERISKNCSPNGSSSRPASKSCWAS